MPKISLFKICLFFPLAFHQCQRSNESSNIETLTPLLLIGAAGYFATSPFDEYAEKNIDLTRFTGSWKEMQRINNGFQSGLSDVMATYTARSDGSIGVRNEGINATGNQVVLEGIALVPSPERGLLKVSFAFPFFFGDFIILRIDRQNYQTALIGGPTPNFLWIFSRNDTIDSAIQNGYIEYAKGLGYNTGSLARFRTK